MPPSSSARPRVAFVGLGWIGRHRLAAVLEQHVVDVIAVADADATARDEAQRLVPDAAAVASFEDALALAPDGVVLATPSAMHASQTIAALQSGAAVFCQKPLGRNATEVHAVIDAARAANRLLGLDVSYRHTEGLSRIRGLVREGCIGRVYAMDLTFHNAYGPDKPWFYDLNQSGGGCLLDLGVHLVDFLLWTFEEPVTQVTGRTYARGQRVQPGDARVEDFASATSTDPSTTSLRSVTAEPKRTSSAHRQTNGAGVPPSRGRNSSLGRLRSMPRSRSRAGSPRPSTSSMAAC
jgi:predicted dehydrogenase